MAYSTMAFDEQLAQRVRAALADQEDLVEIKMFGGLCFTIRGNMCCGVLDDELILRLDPVEAEQVRRMPHTREFDFTRRPLRGFVVVLPEAVGTSERVRGWVRMSQEFAAGLPRKVKKK